MTMQTKMIRKLLPAFAVAAVLALAGCATQPYGNNGGYNNTGTRYGTSYGGNDGGARNCANCGVVQSVQQVYIGGGSSNNNHVLGTVLGALAGGVLGNTVGKGDGRKAATVAGAVAGGVAGNQIAKHNANGSGGSDVGYQVTVRLDNGRVATVTQRENPGVRSGDYVQVSNDHVYLR